MAINIEQKIEDYKLKKMEDLMENTVEGSSLYLPRIKFFTNDIYFTKEYNIRCGKWDENIIKDFLYTIILESNFILDIGSHCGIHTISYSTINPDLEIYSFEPQIKMFELLKSNIELNKLKNVKLFNNAVGHENNKKVSMNNTVTDGPNSGKIIEYGGSNDFNLGGVSLGKNGNKTKMITIDSLNLENCDFMKIDVEGFEKHVLIGAMETIQKFKPVIFFENNKKENEAKGVYKLDKKYEDMGVFEFIFKELEYELIFSTYGQNYIAMYKRDDISKVNSLSSHPMTF